MIDIDKIENLLIYTKELNLLYVEDSEETRKNTLGILDEFFDNIYIACDGLDGLNQYKQFHNYTGSYFDMVISDIRMPNMDGIDLTKSIYEINPNQKIIIISAYDDKEYLLPLINLGVTGFVQKPMLLSSIVEILESVYIKRQDKNTIDLGNGYSFDLNLNILFYDNLKVELTTNEKKLLKLFLSNKGVDFSLEMIHNYLFSDNPYKEYSKESIRSIIKRLRSKLPKNLIINNKTAGYSIDLR